MEIPAELMHGPRLVAQDAYAEDDDQRPDDERVGDGYDLRYILGPRAASRLVGRRASWMNPAPNGATARGGRALPPGGGYTPPPGAPREGETFTTSRDLSAKRDAYYRAKPERSGGIDSPWNRWPPVGLPDDPSRDTQPPVQARPVAKDRPVIPGERRYRDGDHVRHPAFGEGTVVTSKLTRDDEEVTVAFPERGVKKLLASLANLDIVG
jgi:hypothetical protein